MNIIQHALPTSINLSGARAPIRSDFRVWMEIEQLYQNAYNGPKERVLMALMLCYEHPENINDFSEAVSGLLWFFRCGIPTDPRLAKMAEQKAFKRIYDYEQDAEYIYAAFLEQYGVDLCDIEYLHWWKFKAMFHALSEDRFISKIMAYRNTNLSEINDKEARNRIAQKQALYRLRDGKSEEEKADMLFYVEDSAV